MKEMFMELKYLNGELSELEANVPCSITRKTLEEIQLNHFKNYLFDSTLVCTKENLADTYSRFIISEKFIDNQSTHELIDENVGLIQSK